MGELRVFFCAIALWAITASCAEAAKSRSFRELIDRLAVSGPVNKTFVEGAVGAKLQYLSGSDVMLYAAHQVKLVDATIDNVDYRELSTNGISTFFLLRLSVSGVCVARDEIEQKYAPVNVELGTHMEVDRAPVFLNKHETWGDLLFEFSLHGDNCLKAIVYRNTAKAAN